MLTKLYTPVWHKYRPAILKMMLDAATAAEPQQYRMSAHEFRALNAKQKGGYNFTLQVSKGKAINNIKASVVAQDLLEVLQLSKKAIELIDEAPYEISMDKQFVLHINKIAPAPAPAV
jgi:hypothetical protein